MQVLGTIILIVALSFIGYFIWVVMALLHMSLWAVPMAMGLSFIVGAAWRWICDTKEKKEK